MQVTGRWAVAALVVPALLGTGCGGPDKEPDGVAPEPPQEYDAEERAIQREAIRWLGEHERTGLRTARRPAVLSTRVVSLESYQDNAAEVVLERCVDRSAIGTTRGGEPVPTVRDGPVVQRVVVIRYENRTWRVGSIATTDRPCDG